MQRTGLVKVAGHRWVLTEWHTLSEEVACVQVFVLISTGWSRCILIPAKGLTK